MSIISGNQLIYALSLSIFLSILFLTILKTVKDSIEKSKNKILEKYEKKIKKRSAEILRNKLSNRYIAYYEYSTNQGKFFSNIIFNCPEESEVKICEDGKKIPFDQARFNNWVIGCIKQYTQHQVSELIRCDKLEDAKGVFNLTNPKPLVNEKIIINQEIHERIAA